jgi:A/G-specific adenine glycosylase
MFYISSNNVNFFMNWSTILVDWFTKNKRNLPWRDQKNPYHVLISEYILQQTRVDQGTPYYYRFIERFPNVQSLAMAQEQEVLMVWQGLGYYSRARNLHKGAQLIQQNWGGDIPKDVQTLISIPGIGPYTAAAISSIAFDMPSPLIDGNVYRLICRLFEIPFEVPGEKAKKEVYTILEQEINHHQPSVFNQALMEFGALVCTPRNPLCEECPLRFSCLSAKHHTQQDYPVKKKKKKSLEVHFQYLHFYNPNNDMLLYQRTKGIWIGLYEFPLFETSHQATVDDIHEYIHHHYDIENYTIVEAYSCIHKLTHRTIFTKFYKIFSTKLPKSKNITTFEAGIDELTAWPFHRLMKNYLDKSLLINHD